MSLNGSEKSCAVCHAYLFDEDDVVYCPICGAPHHRECYNRINHCALEEFHGTDKQYDKLKAQTETKTTADNRQNDNAEGLITCGMCHEKYAFSNNSCPKCGAPNIARAGGSFVSFDFLGGVPADYDIGEGITAEEAKRFVAANTPRYIPKFAMLTPKNKASWNWMAFLFPAPWMLSRKMYKNGIVTALLTVIATLFTLPFNNAIYSLGFADAKNYADVAANVYAHLPEIGVAVLVAATIGLIFNIIIRVVTAIYGDYFYKNHTIEAIKKIRAESEDMDTDYRKKGGVNIFLFLLGTMAIQYLPAIIAMFI